MAFPALSIQSSLSNRDASMGATRSVALSCALVLAVAVLAASCTFVTTWAPDAAPGQGVAAWRAAGVPASEIDAHAVWLKRLPGNVLAGSTSIVPGTTQPLGNPREVFSAHLGRSGQLYLRGEVDPRSKCAFSPQVVDVLNSTLDEMYRQQPLASIPANVTLVFVPYDMAVTRSRFSWRLGSRATLQWWFQCEDAAPDDSLLGAYFTLAHELTHAAVDYRGAAVEHPAGIEADERIADGATACLFLQMPAPLGDRLRQLHEAKLAFRNPADATQDNPDKQLFCDNWKHRMANLPH